MLQTLFVPPKPTPPKIGNKLPASIVQKVRLPATLVWHIDCLSCGLNVPTHIDTAFKQESVIHVVAALEHGEYREIAAKYGQARIIYVNPNDAAKMGILFGPNMQRYDPQGKLVWFQKLPQPNLQEAVNEARKH